MKNGTESGTPACWVSERNYGDIAEDFYYSIVFMFSDFVSLINTFDRPIQSESKKHTGIWMVSDGGNEEMMSIYIKNQASKQLSL